VIEHPIQSGWKLDEDMHPDESTTSFHRFRVSIDPKKTETLVVKEHRPISRRYELTNLNDDQIGFFLEQKMINPEVEQALRQIIRQKNDIAALDAEINSRQAQITSISEDQQRVRENMKALKGSAEEKTLVERYARQLNQQEDQMESLHKQISDLQQKRDDAQKALNNSVQQLSLEAKI
jgi:chromosome segregation ATPase